MCCRSASYRSDVSPAFVLTRAERGPTAQVRLGREATHVATGLSHHNRRAVPVDTGNRIQQGQHRLERAQPPIDLGRQPVQGFVQKVDLREDLLNQERVMRPKAPWRARCSAGSF